MSCSQRLFQYFEFKKDDIIAHLEEYKEEHIRQNINVFHWTEADGQSYRFRRKQFEDFLIIANSPLYKALT